MHLMRISATTCLPRDKVSNPRLGLRDRKVESTGRTFVTDAYRYCAYRSKVEVNLSISDVCRRANWEL